MTSVSPELAQQFLAYDWPGNVRQLENLVKRMVVLGTEAGIARELLQPIVAAPRLSISVAGAVAAPPVHPPAAAAAVVSATSDLEMAAPADVATVVSLKDIARTAAREAERDLIMRMLTRTRWNRKEAAQILGISYKALLYKIKENGLDKAS
jgi:two-component system response regulator AtoC